MHCPLCKNTALAKKSTTTGVELDTCRRCGSVLLDTGEIFLHLPSKYVSAFDKAIETSVNSKEKSGYNSPKTGKEMYNLTKFPTQSNQFFVDDERNILATEKGINELKQNSSFSLDWAEASAPATRYIKALPNLVLSSTITFGALYGLVALALITISLVFEADQSTSGEDGIFVGGSLLAISFVITLI
ncbi:MAG: zf-TFIIB domain-containing protein, partial [Candidatus Thermoplasmatota archaeon]|nr:zf-TFIIB domain-containing protein [Candidatus Thermoplasmatota archaeon]